MIIDADSVLDVLDDKNGMMLHDVARSLGAGAGYNSRHVAIKQILSELQRSGKVVSIAPLPGMSQRYYKSTGETT